MTAGIVLISLLVIAALAPVAGVDTRRAETVSDIDPQYLARTR